MHGVRAFAVTMLLAPFLAAVPARAGALPHHTPGTTYDVVDVVADSDGARHVRLDRRYRGLRVVGGDLVAHLRADGQVVDVTFATDLPLRVGTVPRVTAAAAAAVAGLPGARAELVVDARRSRLAWDVGAARHVLVDALDARVLDAWETVLHAEGKGHGFHSGTVPLRTTATTDGYVLRDTTRGGLRTADGLYSARPLPDAAPDHMGVYPDFTDADNEWGDGTPTDRATAAVDAHYAGAMTWDYLRKVHRRNGLDGKGQGFSLFVHRGPENEAAWDPKCWCATFGDGDGVTTDPWVSLDMVGHEVAHGLVGATARLAYSGEPGALNEATGDIVGTLVEFFANNAKDRPDYVFGDRIFRNGRGLRRMDDPAASGRIACWSPAVATADRYVGMGVATHFFYLLAAGSGRSRWGDSATCDGAPAVRGIGNAAAGAIWYRALTVYMTSTTGYVAARTATLRAARDLYGTRGAQYRAVRMAWDAVGVKP